MKSEPVLTAGAIAGAIVAVLALFGIVLDTNVVETLIAAVLPVVLALIARAKVTPTG